MTQDVTVPSHTVPRYWDPSENRWLPVRRNPPPSENSPSQPAAKVQRPLWPLTVASVQDLTPEMRSIRLGGDGLQDFVHEPGADLVVHLPVGDGQVARRHYTTRKFDRAHKLLDVNVVMHGNGPGLHWASSARVGDRVEIVGPVLRRQLAPDADWYLLAGDETAIPAIFGLVEALPATATALVFLEVSVESERQPLVADASVDLTWLFRGDTPGEESRLLVDTIGAHALMAGKGDAFLAGETGYMRELRQLLLTRGFQREQVFAMGYWRPGRFGGDETIRE